jgi:hypothetical protein
MIVMMMSKSDGNARIAIENVDQSGSMTSNCLLEALRMLSHRQNRHGVRMFCQFCSIFYLPRQTDPTCTPYSGVLEYTPTGGDFDFYIDKQEGS